MSTFKIKKVEDDIRIKFNNYKIIIDRDSLSKKELIKFKNCPEKNKYVESQRVTYLKLQIYNDKGYISFSGGDSYDTEYKITKNEMNELIQELIKYVNN